MNIKKYIIRTTPLSDLEEKNLDNIFEKISFDFPIMENAEKYIDQIIALLHNGIKKDFEFYTKEIIVEFFIALNKIQPYKERIYEQLAQLDKFTPNSAQEKTHIVNIYRNVISDLFDVYVSIIIATLQYLEGKFVAFKDSNVGMAERAKYEYAYSRLKPTEIFKGYEPIIRNAISHSGSDSIIYEETSIIFKSIKRGKRPKVEYLKLTVEELLEKINHLFDFIHSIDFSIEIFALDVSDQITKYKELTDKIFVWLLDKETRKSIINNPERLLNKIHNSTIEEETKIDLLSKLLFASCCQKEMPINSIKIANSEGIIVLRIPEVKIDLNNYSELFSRVCKLFIYGIDAKACFKNRFSKYIIVEVSDTEETAFRIVIESEDLGKYIDEEAGLVDLLNDSYILYKDKFVFVDIDFKKVEENEYKSLAKTYPRKKRQ